MVALLSKFRNGDRVRVDARGEFYAHIDGWSGRVIAVGPCGPTAVHMQVPEGHCAIHAPGRTDAEVCVFLVPHDQLAFDL